MSSILCLDIGNTRIKAGIFSRQQSPQPKESLLHTTVFEASEAHNALRQLVSHYAPQAAIYADVTQNKILPDYIYRELQLPTLALDHNTPLPFTNCYETPHTLGKDRLAAIAGAHYFYPRRNVLVIDAGTCIKYDFIDQNANYRGGAIATGIRMQFAALHHFTQALPLINYDITQTPPVSVPLVGGNTTNALLSGVLHQTAAACNGIVAQYQQQYPQLLTLVTGGDAPFLQQTLSYPSSYISYLILYGLYHIYGYATQSAIEH